MDPVDQPQHRAFRAALHRDHAHAPLSGPFDHLAGVFRAEERRALLGRAGQEDVHVGNDLFQGLPGFLQGPQAEPQIGIEGGRDVVVARNPEGLQHGRATALRYGLGDTAGIDDFRAGDVIRVDVGRFEEARGAASPVVGELPFAAGQDGDEVEAVGPVEGRGAAQVDTLRPPRFGQEVLKGVVAHVGDVPGLRAEAGGRHEHVHRVAGEGAGIGVGRGEGAFAEHLDHAFTDRDDVQFRLARRARRPFGCPHGGSYLFRLTATPSLKGMIVVQTSPVP